VDRPVGIAVGGSAAAQHRRDQQEAHPQQRSYVAQRAHSGLSKREGVEAAIADIELVSRCRQGLKNCGRSWRGSTASPSFDVQSGRVLRAVPFRGGTMSSNLLCSTSESANSQMAHPSTGPAAGSVRSHSRFGMMSTLASIVAAASRQMSSR
jgi:hypothetical protein